MPKERDIDLIMKDVEKEREEEYENTKKSARPLHELVAIKNFLVSQVVSESAATKYTPGPIRVGGRNPSHSGGYQTYLTMSVKPNDPNIPIKELAFYGASIVKNGDYVTAKIPRFEVKQFGREIQGSVPPPKYYLPRKFKEKESAIELIIKSEDGKIIRIDRAIDYSTYQPPKKSEEG